MKRLELYMQGLSDGEIAEIEGAKRGTITTWRKRKELPPNKKSFRESLPKDKQDEMLRFLVAVHHYKPKDVKHFIDLYREGVV